MNYQDFLTYPLQIVGINEEYDNEITAIEELVKSEIEYSGDDEDIESVLPYFVYFKFCENRESEASATLGEHITVSETVGNSYAAMIRAWNLGVKKLNAICTEKSTTANKYYLSKISFL